jgi:membrane protein
VTQGADPAGGEAEPAEEPGTGAEPEAEAPAEPRPRRFASLRRRIRRSEAHIEAKYDEARAHRAESTPIDVAFRVIEADRRYAGGLIAGGMAFKIFVVLVPFAFVIVAAFGFVGEAVDADEPVQLARELGMTGLVASAINSSIGSSTAERVLTLLVALYALLYTTWNLVRATRAVHGLAWDAPFVTQLARLWRQTLVTVAGLLAFFLLGAAASRLADTVDPAAEVVVRVLAVVAVGVAWILVSLELPRAPETTWRDLVPGGVLVGVGVGVLQFLTIYFFSRYIASKTETYGAIGASVAILVWAYLLGRLIVTSAFLNAARWRRGLEERDSAPAPSPEAKETE